MIGKNELLDRLNEMTEPFYQVHGFIIDLNKSICELAGTNRSIAVLDDIEEVAAKLADLKYNIQVYGVGEEEQ